MTRPPSHTAACPVALVMPQVRRALALLDADPASPTYGCFDRAFWHYRTLVDFPGAAWQQPVWPLALLHGLDRPDNPWAGSEELLRAAAAGLVWWSRIQKRDGSFDEWYRNEHSYCPTAFTTAAATEAVLLLGDALPAAARAAALAAGERAGAWLEPRFNAAVMNQNLAAALALWNLGILTGKPRWRAAAEARLRRVAAAQHDEGWLPEYGGADFGYSTLALDLLAAADARGAGAFAKPMAARLAHFLLQVRGAGPGHPGRLGSRGTAHVFTYGARHFAGVIPEAATLGAAWCEALAAGRVAAPADVDDRYFAYFYLPQFALALAAPEIEAAALPESESAGVTRLPGAGLAVVRRGGWSATVSGRLGGALAIERRLSDPRYLLGYELALAAGGSLASHHWSASAPAGEALDGPAGVTVRCRGTFARRKRALPLVRWSVAFHLFTRLLRTGALAEGFQGLVKRRMVNPRAAHGAALERTITIGSAEVQVRDEIRLLDARMQVASIRPSADIAMHSPSARQDRGSLLPVTIPEDAAERLTRERRLVLEHRFAVDELP